MENPPRVVLSTSAVPFMLQLLAPSIQSHMRLMANMMTVAVTFHTMAWNMDTIKSVVVLDHIQF